MLEAWWGVGGSHRGPAQAGSRAFSRRRSRRVGVLGQGQQGRGPEVEPTWLVKVELATEESRCDG